MIIFLSMNIALNLSIVVIKLPFWLWKLYFDCTYYCYPRAMLCEGDTQQNVQRTFTVRKTCVKRTL